MKQRMRRISALLLVALMCVSCMVPAFAAEGEGCPEIHTKTNCSYKQIGEPHEASCGEQGYTTYQCNDCGVYFADDIVPSKGGHNYQTVQQAPTCVADGFYKKVCLNCGDEVVFDAEDDEDFKATGHTPVYKNGDNCEEGLVCDVCGVTIKDIPDDKHFWGEPELLKAPTHKNPTTLTKGSAKFTCEFCGATKTVDVYQDKNDDGTYCWWQIDAKQYPSCTVAGAQAGAKCVVCGKVEHVVKATGCTAVDCTVPGCAHNTEDCGFVACDDADCEHYVRAGAHCTTKDCTHESCSDAGCTFEPYETIDVIDCIASNEWVVELPTCTEEGKAYKVCIMCEEIIDEPVTLAPTGHNYQYRTYEVAEEGLTAEEIAIFDALANGVTAGTEYTYVINVVDAEPITVTVTVPAYAIEGEDAALTAAAAVAEGDEEEDEDVTYYAWTGEFENVDPTYNRNGDYIYMVWGGDCSTETTSYRYACTTCGAEETPVSWIGHYWSAPVHTDPDCGDSLAPGSDVYTCLNPNCDGLTEGRDEDVEDEVSYTVVDRKAVKTVWIAAEHDFETKTVEANCNTQGYSVDVCKVCEAIDLTKADEGYGSEEDEGDGSGWYDVVEPIADAHAPVDKWIVPVTCETDGLKDIICSRCEKLLDHSVEVEALDHEAGTVVLGTTPATCTTPGYTNYQCKHEGCAKPVQVETAAKLSHSYTQSKVTPDCSKRKPGYTIIKCKNCGEVSPDFVEPTEFDENNPDHHTSVAVLDVIIGDCTTFDIVRYKCNVCNKIWTVDDQDYVVAGTQYTAGEGAGHVLTEVKAVKATCVKDGKKAHYACACGALFADAEGTTAITAADTVVSKLTEDGEHPEDKISYSEELLPTCTEDGHSAGAKCLLCNTIVTPESDRGYDALGHDWETVTGPYGTREPNCTEWGYEWQQCARCDAEQIIKYEPDLGGHKAEKVEGFDATCCYTGLTDGEICSVCGETLVKQEIIEKAAHVNAAGEKFYGICTDTVEDRECVVCKAGEFKYTDAEGEEITIEFECDGNHDDDEDTFVGLEEGEVIVIPQDEKLAQGAHEWHVTRVPATCKEYSYTLVVCAHCGYHFMTGKGAVLSTEHLAWGEWEVIKPATTIEAGLKVRVCATCGEKEELEIPALAGLEIKVDLENGVKPGYALPDNGKVNVVVSTNASDLDVWGIRVELTYTGSMDYTGIVSKGANFANGEVTVHVNEATKTITIFATATTPTATALENVNLDGEAELVTLQFSLKNANLGDIVSVSAGSICEVNDKDQNKIGASIVEEMDYDTYVYAAASIEVTAVSGEIVLDGELDIDDAKELMLYIIGATEEDYNSAADMNQDGEVTATDYAAMRNALLGATGA